ncbi:MAG: hypothetical protein KatS3mg105_1094 [Gemmatales bacterium]|nr:MAG: hypothetical protein KatS3mg105_1094 [Gemmatales bacterium]
MRSDRHDLGELIKGLRHRDPALRRRSAADLAALGSLADAAVPYLIQLIDKDDVATGRSAVRALGCIGPAGLTGIMKALRHAAKQIRREAVWALKRLGPAALPALEGLIERLEDNDLRVRMGAAQAVGAIGPEAEPAIPFLIRCLKHSHLIFCRLAAEALTRIGPASLPALNAARQSSDAFLRREAEWAIQRIQGTQTTEVDSKADASCATAAEIETVPIPIEQLDCCRKTAD